MQCVPKVRKLWDLQKAWRGSVSSCRYGKKAGGIWGAINYSNEKAKWKVETSSRAIKGQKRKEKESKENMAAVKALKEERSMNKSMSLISRTEQLMQLPVMMSKNTLTVVKIGICFHKFRHNNIQIINFNFKILASHFFLFVECLIVNEVE